MNASEQPLGLPHQQEVSRRLVAVVAAVAVLAGALLAALLGPSAALGDARTGDPALVAETEALVGDGDGLQTLSVARVAGGEVTYAGLGDLAGGDAPTPETVYELGSITKVWTGMLLADAVERGEMQLDAPVSTYLPELAGTPAEATTPRQLATHTSGMPRLLGGAGAVLPSLVGNDPYAAWTTQRFLEEVATVEATPTETSEYSNAGMALLGHAQARAAGAESWAALLDERMLTPLEMTDTTIAMPGATESARFAAPHRANGVGETPWTGDGYAPAGSATRTTAADMARFLQATLAGTAPGVTALDPVHTEDGMAHGLAWVVQEDEFGTFTWHNGGTAGSRTMLALDREAGTGALALGNTNRELDELGVALARPGTDSPEAPIDGPGWGLFAALPLVVAVVLLVSAWVHAVGRASRVRLIDASIEAVLAGLLTWVWGPWHLLPHWTLGGLTGLAAGAVVFALMRMPGVPTWPSRRRVSTVVSLVLSVLILAVFLYAAFL